MFCRCSSKPPKSAILFCCCLFRVLVGDALRMAEDEPYIALYPVVRDVIGEEQLVGFMDLHLTAVVNQFAGTFEHNRHLREAGIADRSTAVGIQLRNEKKEV